MDMKVWSKEDVKEMLRRQREDMKRILGACTPGSPAAFKYAYIADHLQDMVNQIDVHGEIRF